MMSEKSNASSWKDPAIWGRVALVVLYLLIFVLIVGPLAILLALAQALFAIFTGADNGNLRGLAAALTEYIRELLLFASWNRGQKPFPFSEFPSFPEPERPTPAAAEAARGETEEENAKSANNSGSEECPECGHVFQGIGWGGMDAHWRSRHEDIMPYEQAWPLIKAGKYKRSEH